MSNAENFNRLAADNRIAAERLERLGRPVDAATARKRAIRYARLAKLAKLGNVVVTK